jgi:hypothetical protein
MDALEEGRDLGPRTLGRDTVQVQVRFGPRCCVREFS